VVSYHRNRAIDWGIAIKAIIPSTMGAIFGALAATMVSARDFKLVIAAAVLVALFLLLFRLRNALNYDAQRPVIFGPKQYVLFFLIGLWLGFIILDGATFLLLALTVSAGVGLVAANAIKSAVILPSVLASMLVFSFESVIDWKIGIILAAGSIFGGFIGARLAMAPAAKKVILGAGRGLDSGGGPPCMAVCDYTGGIRSRAFEVTAALAPQRLTWSTKFKRHGAKDRRHILLWPSAEIHAATAEVGFETK
jgi:hypothetical protein